MKNTTESASITIGASAQNVQTGIPILSGVKVHNGVV
jgi:hypothetical protein